MNGSAAERLPIGPCPILIGYKRWCLHTYYSGAVTHEGEQKIWLLVTAALTCAQQLPLGAMWEEPLPLQLEMLTSLTHLLPNEPAIRVSIH